MSTGAQVPDRQGYYDRWATRHGGYDPRSNVLVRGWLSGAYVLARPLAAARVPPDLITLTGLAVSGLAVALAAGSGWWLLAAAVVVVLSGVVVGPR